MNIVYLLVHKIRLEENNPPYYYIGSKYNWKGEGTYYSSSRNKIVKDAYVEDLIFTPIWKSEDCSKEQLLEVEKEYQIKHDVIKNPLFFNGNIANTLLFSTYNEEERVEKFLKKANSLNEDGIAFKYVWAEKARKVILNRYDAETLSERGRMRQKQPHSVYPDRLVKEVVHEKMMETLSSIGEDGLTGFQRAGKVLSKTLSVKDHTGMTIAQKRIYYGNSRTRTELLGICFFTKTHAQKMFGITKQVVWNIEKGFCSQDTFNKLQEVLGAEYLQQFSLKIKNAGDCTQTIIICGEEFLGWNAVKLTFGVTDWAVEQLSKSKRPNKKLKKSMIERYGTEVYYNYYPELSSVT